MNPMFIIAVPLVLVFGGMLWNGIGLSYDQPPSSAETIDQHVVDAGFARFAERDLLRSGRHRTHCTSGLLSLTWFSGLVPGPSRYTPNPAYGSGGHRGRSLFDRPAESEARPHL